MKYIPLWLGAFGIAFFLIYAISMLVSIASSESECLQAGYPNAKVSWKFEAFCIKRVDQTDIVVPLENIHR